MGGRAGGWAGTSHTCVGRPRCVGAAFVLRVRSNAAARAAKPQTANSSNAQKQQQQNTNNITIAIAIIIIKVMSNGPSLVSVLQEKPVWLKHRDHGFYPASAHVSARG